MVDDHTRKPETQWSKVTAPMKRRAHQAPAELASAETIGRFIVLGQLGSGGMGVVYSAYDPHLDRKVALKLLRTDAHEQAGARLLREAQAMARIDHANVIKVHEAGAHAGAVYIAMELAEGGTIRGWLEEQPRSQREIVAIFVQAGKGLSAAHAAGLIHRDFKPDNVLLTSTGTARVTDFGLVSEQPASETTEVASRNAAMELDLTRTGAMLGTPAYMAPEQFESGLASARTDQFAFCIALYEGIYGQRPFPGSTFEELATSVTAGTMAVPGNVHVPSSLRRILMRGLATDPDERYPTMEALLAELAPSPRRRMWSYVIAAGVLAGGGATAGIALWHGDAGAATCETSAAERAAAVWSPDVAGVVRDRFVKTGRSFATRASQTAGSQLDIYTKHWVQLASDACIAERDAARPPPELLVRRQACLDSRLDTLHGVVSTLSASVSPELVDHAEEISHALPDLETCNDPAVEMPEARDAPTVATLEVELGNANLHAIAGDYTRSAVEGAAIAARADAIGWPSLQVRVHTLIGHVQLAKLEPARKELLRAAELALSHGLDRDAATALSLAIEAAGREGSTDGVATLEPIVRATARRTRDRRVEVAADISIARGLVHANHWEDGMKTCEQARVEAQKLGDDQELGDAEDCLLEAAVPLGRYNELAPLIQRRIDDLAKRCGQDCPALGGYLLIASDVARHQGKLGEARTDAERSLAIRLKDFGPKHFEVAKALTHLAEVAEAEAHPDEAKGLREQALAMTDDTQPIQLITIVQLHTDLAMGAVEAGRDHFPDAFGHFDKATDLIRRRSGDDALELAVLLLNYGQIKADDDLEVGLGMLVQAHEILERHHDKRARTALTMMMVVADHHDRFAEGVRFGEQALASVDSNSRPDEIALIKRGLSRALSKTHGDPDRARQLAHEARELYARLGPRFARDVADVDAWLAQH